jgi:hypothetical protein
VSIIYYNSMNNDAGRRLQKILERELSGKKIESYQSIDELSTRLHQLHLENNIAILFINVLAEIYQIFSIKKSLNNIRIILILSDSSPEIVSESYKLHPRFISHGDSDFNDVVIVLKRMIKLMEKNETPS